MRRRPIHERISSATWSLSDITLSVSVIVMRQDLLAGTVIVNPEM
jgi:hypothetical protein